MTSLTASAQARIGLLGNPSDIYGGQGLGFSIAELGVTVTLAEADTNALPNELFAAAWQLMEAELLAAKVDTAQRPFALTFTSNVPFQGGRCELRSWHFGSKTKCSESAPGRWTGWCKRTTVCCR
jgi:hypothetical protein